MTNANATVDLNSATVKANAGVRAKPTSWVSRRAPTGVSVRTR